MNTSTSRLTPTRPDTCDAISVLNCASSSLRCPTMTKWRFLLSGVMLGRSMTPASWPGGTLIVVVKNFACPASPLVVAPNSLRVVTTNSCTSVGDLLSPKRLLLPGRDIPGMPIVLAQPERARADRLTMRNGRRAVITNQGLRRRRTRGAGLRNR